MDYQLDMGGWQSVFAVPTQLVDRHIKLAGGAAVKVLLYFLRCSDSAVSPGAVSKAVGISAADAEDALAYWQSAGLIRLTGDPAVDEDSGEGDNSAGGDDSVGVDNPIPAEDAPLKNIPKKKDRVRYSYSECAEIMREDADLRHMLKAAEVILGKPLNHTEISVFVTLRHWYGMPPECIALITEHCKNIGKTAAAYIESTVAAWAEDEINTLELVQDKIYRIDRQRSAWGRVRQALDIPERRATAKETLICDRWINEYRLTAEMVRIAYDRCVDKKGKLSMSYMDGIIKNWQSKGIFTPEAAEADKLPDRDYHKKGETGKYNKKSGGTFEATYDKAEIEELLDDDWLN
ncbi:MAG: DnaD domain protein [Oscillospiraceae bacterium]|nr:DnaD domain protein [Oscillospiraceae bacterium]